MAKPEYCGDPLPREVYSDPHGRHWRSETDTSRPVFAVTGLSFYPPGRSFNFAPGDRVEEVLPGDVLRACIERGEASYEKPKES